MRLIQRRIKAPCLLTALSIIIVSVFALSARCQAEESHEGPAVFALPLGALPRHEKLTFQVKWFGVHVGVITASINGIRNIGGREAYELEALAKTNELLSKIYPINDRYVSYMDVEKLHTLRHEVYRREGRYKKDAITDFDQTDHKAYFRNLLDASKKVIEIPPDVQDPLTAAYYFRTIPVGIGKKASYCVYNNENTYELFGVVDKVKRVNTHSLGKREAFHIQPYAKTNGETVRKGKASGYFSCDKNRMLLSASVRAPLFTEVVAYLEKEE